MTTGYAEFRESTARSRIESEPLAHLSIELGHFYHHDLANGVDFFRSHYRRIAGWVNAARADWSDRLAGRRPRISTCVLIDDYFCPSAGPRELAPVRELLPRLLDAARAGEGEIDYIVRESGCAAPTIVTGAGDVSLADLVEARLHEDPPPGSTGARPPVAQTGWLCNGRRPPASYQPAAMKRSPRWRPPSENAAINHSVFADIQLWSAEAEGRQWSCAMLAGVWQLLRLGVLRNDGARVVTARPLPKALPVEWRRLPALVQVNPKAAPFCAYRTLSVLAPLFLRTEYAVRTILGRVLVHPEVQKQIMARGRGEGLDIPPELVDRIEYLFVDTGKVRSAGVG